MIRVIPRLLCILSACGWLAWGLDAWLHYLRRPSIVSYALDANVLLFTCVWWRHEFLKQRAKRRKREGLCPVCGYDVRATPGQCPECGNRLGQPRQTTIQPPRRTRRHSANAGKPFDPVDWLIEKLRSSRRWHNRRIGCKRRRAAQSLKHTASLSRDGNRRGRQPPANSTRKIAEAARQRL